MSAPEKPFATRFSTTTLKRPGSRDCYAVGDGGELDAVEAAPRSFRVDQFPLVEPVDRSRRWTRKRGLPPSGRPLLVVTW